MNILVIGAGSRTASVLVPMLLDETTASIHLASSARIASDHERITSHQLDVTRREDLHNLVLSVMPNAVVNLVAYTDVDGCEQDRALAWRINVTLVEHLARACRSADAQLIHVSTDYVFDGSRGPYAETDTVGPVSYYGKSKLAGENALATSGIDWSVVRTNVVYGTMADKPDFLAWVLQRFDAREPVKAVTDQYSNPTFCDDLCETIIELINRRRTGIYHTGGTDYLSRYEFVTRVADLFHVPTSLVVPVTTADLNQTARRPIRGGLITLKTSSELGVRMTSVEHGLVAFRYRLLQKTKPPQGLMRGLQGT